MMTSPIPTTFNSINTSFLTKYQVAIPGAISSMSTSSSSGASLSDDYQPGPNDVVCGRGKGSYNRPGNKKFRELVQRHVEEYLRAKSKLDKSMVLASIVEQVREHGRFIKRKAGAWCEIGDEQAREKVGHAIREAIAANKASPPTVSMTDSTNNQGRRPSHFNLKHSDLASVQLAMFEDLVARTSAA